MKANDWRKELPFLFMLLFPWGLYLLLKGQFPDPKSPTYQSIMSAWQARGTIKPLADLIFLSGIYCFFYLLLLIVRYRRRVDPLFVELLALRRKRQRYMTFMILFMWPFLGCTNLLSAAGYTGDLSNKSFITIGGTMLFILLAVLYYGLYRGVKKDNAPLPLPKNKYNIIWVSAVLLMLVAYFFLVLFPDVPHAKKYITEALFFSMIIFGNLTYSIKQNRYLGHANRWAIQSEVVWRKTHHLAGILYVIGGVIGLIACFYVPDEWIFPLRRIVTVTTTITLIYSYVTFKRLVENPH